MLFCYIWNLDYVEELVEELGKIRPDMPIWLGGPEVSYDSVDVLRRLHQVKGVMKARGKRHLPSCLESGRIRKATRDLNGRRELPSGKKTEGLSRIHGARRWILARSPLSTATWKNSSIRSSTMRAAGGAHFSCSYCLSSVDKRLRFRDAGLVERELQVFYRPGGAPGKVCGPYL